MAKKPTGRKGAPTLVVIRREEVVEGGHHGGAWKVAYADFVTAMMAFFLLMWLINATSEKQRRGIADYFSPQGSHARSLSGSGKPFGGVTPFATGSLVSNLGSVNLTSSMSQPPGNPDSDGDPDAQPGGSDDTDGASAAAAFGAAARAEAAKAAASAQPGAAPAGGRPDAVAAAPATPTDPDAVPIHGDSHQDGNAGRGTAAANDGEAGDPVPVPRAPPASRPAAGRPDAEAAPSPEAASFRAAAARLRHAVTSDPTLAGLADRLAVDITPEGLRIQIIDGERTPMFDSGSTVPNARARQLLALVAPVLASLDEPVSITGHTDAMPPVGAQAASNWSLSAARADATRMVLAADGLPNGRVAGVTGVADRDPLDPAHPDAAVNRRIVMVVLRAPPPAGGHAAVAGPSPAPPAALRR